MDYRRHLVRCIVEHGVDVLTHEQQLHFAFLTHRFDFFEKMMGACLPDQLNSSYSCNFEELIDQGARWLCRFPLHHQSRRTQLSQGSPNQIGTPTADQLNYMHHRSRLHLQLYNSPPPSYLTPLSQDELAARFAADSDALTLLCLMEK